VTGQTAADTLNDYIYYTNMLIKKNATLIVGLDTVLLSGVGKGYSF